MSETVFIKIKNFNPSLLTEELEAIVPALPSNVLTDLRGFSKETRFKHAPGRRLVFHDAVRNIKVFGEPGEIHVVSNDALTVAELAAIESVLDGHDWQQKSVIEHNEETDAADLDDVDAKFRAGLESLNPIQHRAVVDKVIRMVLRDQGKKGI